MSFVLYGGAKMSIFDSWLRIRDVNSTIIFDCIHAPCQGEWRWAGHEVNDECTNVDGGVCHSTDELFDVAGHICISNPGSTADGYFEIDFDRWLN
jgi:hypothetical protein